jgi:hypothetical protein
VGVGRGYSKIFSGLSQDKIAIFQEYFLIVCGMLHSVVAILVGIIEMFDTLTNKLALWRNMT